MGFFLKLSSSMLQIRLKMDKMVILVKNLCLNQFTIFLAISNKMIRNLLTMDVVANI